MLIIIVFMKKLLACLFVAFCVPVLYSQSQPIVAVDSVTVIREHKGWRVIGVSASPIHFNLLKGDLIVRIDGRNAAETGPMQLAGLMNEQFRREIDLFIERGDLRMETALRQIRGDSYEPTGPNPFKHVTRGFSAPELDLLDIDRQPVTLDQFKDKWLMIDFMGTWCAPCMRTMPEFLNVVNRHRLSLVMVALDDKEGALRHLRQEYNIHAPIVMAKWTDQLPIAFGVATNRWTGQIPGLVLIRPDGEVAFIEIGVNDPDRTDKTIESLMNSKTDESSKESR